MSAELSTLTADEQGALATAEQIIESGLQTFWQVGEALAQVRDGRLYRATHRKFEDYCRARWSLEKSRVYQLIDSAEVIESLTSTNVEVLPENENQARPLASLKPQERVEAWQEAIASAPDGKPTAKDVKRAVEKVTCHNLWQFRLLVVRDI